MQLIYDFATLIPAGLIFSEIFSLSVLNGCGFKASYARCVFEVGIIDKCFSPDREREDDRAVTALGGNRIEHCDMLWWQHIGKAFTVVGHKSIPVDEAAYFDPENYRPRL